MKRTFEHYMIVRQEHLNQYGNLFGGRVLEVIDELAFIACARTYPGRNFVTRAVQDAEFKAPARLGDILEFSFGIEQVGTTSVRVRVTMAVFSGCRERRAVSFDGRVIMVCVTDEGLPAPVGPVAEPRAEEG
jgi:acyl-CoA hydrolase